MSIVIVHLTDIHIKEQHEDNPILDKIEKIHAAIKSTVNRNDHVIFAITGDLAYSGLEEEYNIVDDFITKIKDDVSQVTEHTPEVVMVAGNHDCYFGEAATARSRLIGSFKDNDTFDSYSINMVMSAQNNYSNFSQKYIGENEIINTKLIRCDDKELLFVMINSAWMSGKPEKLGTLLIPNEDLANIDAGKYDCVITLMHHPMNWFTYASSTSLRGFLRRTTDVLLLGHEHIKDSMEIDGHTWSMIEGRGKELQNSKDGNDSGFSIYVFDDDFARYNIFDFLWDCKENRYKKHGQGENVYSRNSMIETHLAQPNKQFVEQLNDIELSLRHPNLDTIRLSDIYCWPDIEEVDFQHNRYHTVYKGRGAIIENLIKNQLSIVVGDSLSGKTALAKSLFRGYVEMGKLCLICNGEMINSYKEQSIDKLLMELFVGEYGENSIDTYEQFPINEKILLIDNFDRISLSNNKKQQVILYLLTKFQNIIAFSYTELDAISQISVIYNQNKIDYKLFRIMNMGNVKRRELVSKWFNINGEYDEDSDDFIKKVDKACKKINDLLGSKRSIFPTNPIYLLNLLQDIDSVEQSFSGSQYGFLYETLVQKSLSVLSYKSPGDLNIDIVILSALAFNMVQRKTTIFTKEELDHIIDVYSEQKIISVQSTRLLENMMIANIIYDIGVSTGNYKFKYPYLLYYFTGRHIAYNSQEPEVIQCIEYMSKRLHNEDYGNIIIFACHFSNNREIIEDVLINAYDILNKYAPFSFNQHIELLENANRVVDTLLVQENVGREEDIPDHKAKQLEYMDEIGISSGDVQDIDDYIDDDINEREKSLAEYSSASKTIEVLGRIISNYPGDIDGKTKTDIIEEMYLLGMRLVGSFLAIVNSSLEDFIQMIMDGIDANREEKNEFANIIKSTFAFMIGDIAQATIKKIAVSMDCEHLLCAINKVFNDPKNISQQLVLQELNLNCLGKVNVNRVCKLKDDLEKDDNSFALTLLRSTVSKFLCYNHCGQKVRNQLCEKFNLSQKDVFIALQKNTSVN